MKVMTTLFTLLGEALEGASLDHGRMLKGAPPASGAGIYDGINPLTQIISLFLVQATLIIGLCRFLGLAGPYLKQPSVVFEIIAGIFLGPSALMRNQWFKDAVFPPTSIPYLQLVANIGLTFYLFIVGMELDVKMLVTHFRKTATITLMGISIPFAVGVGVSGTLYHNLQPDSSASKTSFFVFIGTSMAITAFPVLARMLKEGGFIYTRPGAMALGAAAVGDGIAWTLLALSIAIASGGNANQAGYIFGTGVGLVFFLFLVVKPAMEFLVEYGEVNNIAMINNNIFAFSICMLFMCAWFTELIGLDTIFGAFLFGLCIPRGTRLFNQCREYIEQFVLTFTLPLYFAISGIKTDVTTISTNEDGAMLVLVIVLAAVSKFTSCTAASLLSGLTLRESAVVGAFMNCKGLVELIVLNVGLNAKILSTRTFTVMVLMALATTFITSPIVEFLYPPVYRKAYAEAEKGDLEMVELEGTDSSGELDLRTLPNRVGVVVESLSQMQSFVNLLSYFLPFKSGSELSTTLMHFQEPTKSEQDKFIGLNEQGRLIRIDEEPTDIATALYLKEKDATIPKPELLPLASFCNAFHVPVNAFRVEGDPVEFPSELRSLANNNDVSLLMMPFKAHSQFSQSMFWGSLKAAPAPVLLVAELRDKEIVEAEAARGRSRTGSFQGASYKDLESGVQSDTPTLYTNVPANAMPIHRRKSVTNAFTKKATEPKRDSVIVAVLLGKTSDVLILSLIPRFAQNASNEVHLVLPKDYEHFPQPIHDHVRTLKEQIHECKNVRWVEGGFFSNDYDALIAEVNAMSFDLFLSPFVEPKEDPALRLLVSSENSYINADAVMRLVSSRNAAQERITNRLAAGMPDNCVYSSCVHPELGLLASRLYEKDHVGNSLVVVVHEPLKVRKATAEKILAIHGVQPEAAATEVALSNV